MGVNNYGQSNLDGQEGAICVLQHPEDLNDVTLAAVPYPVAGTLRMMTLML